MSTTTEKTRGKSSAPLLATQSLRTLRNMKDARHPCGVCGRLEGHTSFCLRLEVFLVAAVTALIVAAMVAGQVGDLP